MQLRRTLVQFGVDLEAGKRAVRGLANYRFNRSKFRAQAAASAGEFRIGDNFPCPGDRFESGGTATGHYFHQDLYVAQQIFAARPNRHLDVGSRVDGFVAHVASFRQVEVLDIRPTDQIVPNMRFHRADVMELGEQWAASTDSLSCLHALEHFGLGRYGDSVDYYGFRKGWENLVGMVRPKGTLYLSVPIGRSQRVEFDGQRIFSVPYLREEMIGERFVIDRFAYVDDEGAMNRDADVFAPEADRSFDLACGCGIFTLRRT